MDTWMYISIGLVAAAGALLSFVSGFGLGTLLLPVFMIFFPPQVAIACTAVVHMLNNLFKLALVGKHAHRGLCISFGATSLIGALAGAYLLSLLDPSQALFSYTLGEKQFTVGLINGILGILIVVFTLFELQPTFRARSFGPIALHAGGVISGFFGGLSGHQGALRSAFLMKAGLSKEAFLGTRTVLACIVDLSRLSVYVVFFTGAVASEMNWPLVVFATISAAAGAYTGNTWMKKTELPQINRIITISLLLFGVALGLGWI
jgi:uncharacterized membrane protein YfcA